VAYSDKDGRSGLFMLATPDPDIAYLKATFFQRYDNTSVEGRYAIQYLENTKPYELGYSATYSEEKIGFSTDLKTPHSEDLNIEVGFISGKRVEVKVFILYGADNKVDTLVKYLVK
jgi:hypothetical protein